MKINFHKYEAWILDSKLKKGLFPFFKINHILTLPNDYFQPYPETKFDYALRTMVSSLIQPVAFGYL